MYAEVHVVVDVWFQEMDHTQSKLRKCFVAAGSMAGIDNVDRRNTKGVSSWEFRQLMLLVLCGILTNFIFFWCCQVIIRGRDTYVDATMLKHFIKFTPTLS